MSVAVSPIVQARHVTKRVRAAPRRRRRFLHHRAERDRRRPNGSGKSTIFRVICGYLAPSSGTVEVAGYDVMADSIEVRRAISYVPEDLPVYDHMRVVEFLRSWETSRDCAAVACGKRSSLRPSAST